MADAAALALVPYVENGDAASGDPNKRDDEELLVWYRFMSSG